MSDEESEEETLKKVNSREKKVDIASALADYLNRSGDGNYSVIDGKAVLIWGKKNVLDVDKELAGLTRPNCTMKLELNVRNNCDYLDGHICCKLDSNMKKLLFCALPLPIGDVAIASHQLNGRKGATRFGLHSAILDPNIWCAKLVQVSAEDLVQSLTVDQSELFRFKAAPDKLLFGHRFDVEGQHAEYKFPEERTCLNKWVTKRISDHFIPLLNGSKDSEVKMWLGVYKNGLAIGAPLDMGGTNPSVTGDANLLSALTKEFRYYTLNVFPSLDKEAITVTVYGIETPNLRNKEFVVHWMKSNKPEDIREAWKIIAELNAQGWIIESDDCCGVVKVKSENNLDTAKGYEHINSEVVFDEVDFSRYVIEVSAKPKFEGTYVNGAIQIGDYSPLDVWLRLHKSLSNRFMQLLHSSLKLSIKIGNCVHDLDCTIQVHNESNVLPCVERILEDSVKEIVVVLEMENLSLFVQIFEQVAASIFESSAPTWFVAIVVSKTFGLKQLQKTVTELSSFNGKIKIIELLPSIWTGPKVGDYLSAFPGFVRYGFFDVISPNLPPQELENLPKHAFAFLFPETNSSVFPSWGVVRDFLAQTEAVDDIIACVQDKVRSWRDWRYKSTGNTVRVFGKIQRCGVTSVLAKAAYVCSERFSAEVKVVFVHESIKEQWQKQRLIEFVKCEKCPVVLFCDLLASPLDLSDFQESPIQPLLVIGSHREGDIEISMNWSEGCLEKFALTICKLPWKDTSRVRLALNEFMRHEKDAPFYLMLLTAANGRYKPLIDWIVDQNEAAEERGIGDLLASLSFLSLTVDKSCLHGIRGLYDRFESRVLFPLLVTQRRSISFVHPDVARIHLHVRHRSPNVGFWQLFPIHALELWKEINPFYRTVEPINLNRKVVNQIIFSRKNTEWFSKFTKFALHEHFFEDYIASSRLLIKSAGISDVDVEILLSRLYREQAGLGINAFSMQ